MLNSKKAIIFALLFSFAFAEVSAQQEEQGAYQPDYDTNYIKDYRHRLSVGLLVDFKNVVLGILQESSPVISYKTNLPLPMYGFIFSYRWLNFSVSLPIKKISQSDNNYTQTDGFSMALSVTKRKWYFRNFYEDYTGFQLTNPENIDPNYYQKNNLNPDFKDMRQRNYYATIYYGFNGNNYSHRNLLWQSETQKKSAGSFLLGFSGGYKWVDSPRGLIPTYLEEDSTDAEDVLTVNYLNIGLNFGYSHTFVLPYHFNFSAMLVPAISFIDGYTQNRMGEENKFRSKLGINAESRVQLSYNTKNIYAGVSYSVYAFNNGFNDDFSIGTFHNLLRFNIGYHFHLKPITALEKFDLSN